MLAAGEQGPSWLYDELQRIFAGREAILRRLAAPEAAPGSPRGGAIRTRGGSIGLRGGAPSPAATSAGGVRTRSGAAPVAGSLNGLARQLHNRTRPRQVTRHADVSCPDRVHLQTKRISLVVRLLTAPPIPGTPTDAMTLEEHEGVRIQLDAPGFDLLSPQVQNIEVRPGADSLPVVFDLRPREIGWHALTVNFFQHGNPVGTVTVRVECTDYEVAAATATKPRALRAYTAGAAPDMVLLVAAQDSPPALRFTLMQDGGAWWRSFAPIPLEGNLASYSAGLYRSLTGLVGRSDPVNAAHGQTARRLLSPAEVDGNVRKHGQNLWKTLIPPDLKALYAENRDAWRNRSLLLLSDEPTLPWELVWPYGADWKDEHPWCCTFRLTRWLRRDPLGNGSDSPPPRLVLRALSLLAPHDSNLPSAQLEQKQLLELASQHGIADLSPTTATWSLVMQLLEDGHYDWLHVAAHGNFYPESPDGHTALWLQDRIPLTPDSIVGPEIEGHIQRKRPGFVFNACEVGRQGRGLTGLAGWATRLVCAGAGLFAGPLWEVTDDGALAFVMDFYRRVLAGATVGEAVQQARLTVQKKGDPTWLAYSVYAHPNAQVVLAEDETA
jgi:hypothetical protein